ncbi:MAG: flavin-dependent trigonelline monooxygenase, reductase component [Caballeronia sp.]|jgi:hypothetical protein|nr:flavin-dependent trigonelline monooxygenase, reductase component [Caballeronia sp.]
MEMAGGRLLPNFELMKAGYPPAMNANLGFSLRGVRGEGVTHIYYRGRIVDDAPAAADVRYVPLGAIPWDRIRDPAVESMLRRYVKERTENAFGIYVGDVEKGMVQAFG